MKIIFNDYKAFKLAFAYFLYFGFLCLEFTYLSSYMITELKFTGKEITIIYGVIPIISLLSQPFWGQIADATQKTGKVLRWCTFLGLLSFIPLYFSQTFYTFMLSLWLLAFCQSTVPSLIDTLSLTRFGVQKYGDIRVWGSLGYGAFALAFALLFSVKSVIVSIICALFLCWLSALIIGEEDRRVKAEKKIYLLTLLRNPSFLILIIFSTLHWSSNIPYHIILNIHSNNLGLSISITGYAITAGIIAESLFIYYFPKWSSKLLLKHWLLLSASMTALRWGIMTYPLGASLFIAIQVIHGFSFGVFFVASISYIVKIVPVHMRASGQTLFSAFTFGLGNILGTLYLGLLDSPGKGYYVFGMAAFASLLSLIVTVFIRQHKNFDLCT